MKTYVQGLGVDNPVSMYCGGTMHWYHKDARGSIYQMTDESEVSVQDISRFWGIEVKDNAEEN